MPVTLVHAWTDIQERQQELGRLLGAKVVVYRKGRLRHKAWAPVRWVLNAARFAWLLRNMRPDVILVTNPPIWPALMAARWVSRHGSVLILDSHPGGFGLQGDSVAGRLQFLHRWAAARAAGVLVPTAGPAETVRNWGARAEVYFEAPLEWEVRSPAPRDGGPLRLLYVGNFNPDEPVEVVLSASSKSSGWVIGITGDPTKAPAGWDEAVAKASAIEYMGWLEQSAYLAALQDCDAVCVLTTDPASVMRAGVEATHAVRPLIVSDTPTTRLAFPHAIHIGNEPAELQEALRQILSHPDVYAKKAALARALADRQSKEHADALKHLVLGAVNGRTAR